MALSSVGKVGVAAGLGVGATLLTDGAIQYWGTQREATATEDNWYFANSSIVGGGVSLLAALAVYKLWGSEEAVACAVAGVGTALAIPARDKVEELVAGKVTGSGLRSTRGTWARTAMAAAR